MGLYGLMLLLCYYHCVVREAYKIWKRVHKAVKLPCDALRAAPRVTQDVGSSGWPWTPPSPMRPRAGCGGTEMRRWH